MPVKSIFSKAVQSARNTLRALKYRNYRLYFTGQGFSLIGTWMQQVAMGWYVYRITHSPFSLGLIGFLNQFPSLFLSPFAGVMVDRFNKKTLMAVTQALMMLQAFTLAVLVLTGLGNIWNIAILSFFMGVLNSLDAPVRQSLVIELIDEKADLSNAIALNSAMFNGARLVGPAIAGVMIAWLGEGACFLLNGASYIAVLCAIAAINIPEKTINVKKSKVLAHLKEGLSYSAKSIPIRYIILIMALVSFLGMSYIVLMPVIAKDVLHGGPHTMGFLMGSVGVGALIGALYLASRKSVLGLGRRIPYHVIMMSAGLIGLSLSKIFILSMSSLFVVGFSMIMLMGSCNTILQTVVDDDKRGRVMSLYTLAFMGFTPFGSLLLGWLSGWAGVSIAILFSGVSCLAGGLLFLARRGKFRQGLLPVYEKLGIIKK